MTNHPIPILELENKLSLSFTNHNLLKQAFVHRSYLNEHDGDLASNEKLEFLGDSVLSLITSIYLFKTYPEYNEGIYTDIKAAIVRTESLSEAARRLELGKYLYLSRGERDNNGEDNTSILADCFEALLAAVFLEFGFDHAYEFVKHHLFADTLDVIVQNKLYQPAKNRLQEYYQEKYKQLPIYTITSETGPQHNKQYKVGVFHNRKLLATGEGKSKKEAEEDAAAQALQRIDTPI